MGSFLRIVSSVSNGKVKSLETRSAWIIFRKGINPISMHERIVRCNIIQRDRRVRYFRVVLWGDLPDMLLRNGTEMDLCRSLYY